MLDDYEQKLLQGWEEVYKKSQLTLWILLSLKDGPKNMAKIKDFITDNTNGLIGADDKSMYRALRRFTDADMLEFSMRQTKNGPELKIYRLSETGQKILASFIKRNIAEVFFNPNTQKLLFK